MSARSFDAMVAPYVPYVLVGKTGMRYDAKHYSSPGLARLLEEVERIVRPPVLEVVPHKTWTVAQDGVAEHTKSTMKPTESALAV